MAISDRLPPTDDRAEMAVVGAIIRDNKVLSEVGSLQPGHFVEPVLGGEAPA